MTLESFQDGMKFVLPLLAEQKGCINDETTFKEGQ